MKKAILVILAIILFIAPCFVWGHMIVKSLQFSADCTGYLKLAGDANNIDVAEKHLSTAIAYIENNGMTSGHTKIIRYYPTNDFGLWYENLKTAQTQLQEMQAREYTELEESNMLMKLRETLLNEEGSVTHPEGAPFKDSYSLVFWLALLLWIPCWVLGCVFVVAAFDLWW